MSKPTKQTPGGRAYLELQNRARREKRTTQELLILYVLERWLARLAASPYTEHFVLKGGLLLHALDARRPTIDADLLARQIANDVDTVTARVVEIARVHLHEDDGVVFLTETAVAQTIREEALYAGVRIQMDAQIATANIQLKLDVNVGDPVTPRPRLIALPSQRPGYPPVSVLGYPIETICAEKAATAIALGAANTRVRDFADLYTLTGKYRLAYATMRAALAATLRYRDVTLVPLSAVIGDLAVSRERAYRTYRDRLGVDGIGLPDDFAPVISAVIAFIDPLAGVDAADRAWDPSAREWCGGAESD
jgi:hypothetical protein